jgi:hypothetical protein
MRNYKAKATSGAIVIASPRTVIDGRDVRVEELRYASDLTSELNTFRSINMMLDSLEILLRQHIRVLLWQRHSLTDVDAGFGTPAPSELHSVRDVRCGLAHQDEALWDGADIGLGDQLNTPFTMWL